MFFKSLSQLLGSCESISVDMTAESGGNIALIVKPRPKYSESDGKVLATPLILKGTPHELDDQFADLVTQFSAAHKSLSEQLDATRTVLEAAKKESAKKAGKAIRNAGAPVAPETSSTCEEEESICGSDGDDDANSAPQTVSTNEGVITDNLFE